MACFGSHQFLCQHLSILIRFLFQQSRSEKRIKEKWNQDTKIHAAISKERFCRTYQFSSGNWLWKGVNTIYVRIFLLQRKEYIRCCNEYFKKERSDMSINWLSKKARKFGYKYQFNDSTMIGFKLRFMRSSILEYKIDTFHLFWVVTIRCSEYLKVCKN